MYPADEETGWYDGEVGILARLVTVILYVVYILFASVENRFSTDASFAIFVCVQVWVKPPEVLARDRLLGSYKVSVVHHAYTIPFFSNRITLYVCFPLQPTMFFTHCVRQEFNFALV